MRPSPLLPLGLLLAWAAFCLSGWGVQSGGALRQWWQIPLLAGGCCRLWAPPFFVLSLLWWWCWFPSPCLLGGMGAVAPAGGDCGGASFDRAGATAPATGVGCRRRSSWFLSVWVFLFSPLIECPGHWLLRSLYILRHARPNGPATDLVSDIFMPYVCACLTCEI